MTIATRRALVLAPAKVNLSLRIVGKRDDGYHLLESLMYPVGICDEVEITVGRPRRSRPEIRCRVTGTEKVPSDEKNLAARAAALVVDELDAAADVAIRVHKVIPVGAGLGGGSSDAAAVLVTLPGLLGKRLSRQTLVRLAAKIGADVPFFVSCRPAWATGIGEKLRPLVGAATLDLVVVVPRARVSTAWAYANALPPRRRWATRARPRKPSCGLLPTSKSLSCGVSNDFEAGVATVIPDVVRLKRRLEALGAIGTVMSGSGSAMVGVFASSANAREAAREFRRPDRAWATRSLSRRPRSGE